MEFSWSEAKRHLNLKNHGLDFVDASRACESVTFTFEDDRFTYREQRFVTLGLLAGIYIGRRFAASGRNSAQTFHNLSEVPIQ